MVATGRPYPVEVERGGFSRWRQQPVRGAVNDGNAAHALGGVAGHAGLLGPVRDLLTLGAALLDDGLVHPDVLDRFAAPSPVDATQALGFRRVLRAGPGGTPVTWLWHGGFTGTVWALDPASGTVVAGGATRLHGTTGPLPRWWPAARHPGPPGRSSRAVTRSPRPPSTPSRRRSSRGRRDDRRRMTARRRGDPTGAGRPRPPGAAGARPVRLLHHRARRRRGGAWGRPRRAGRRDRGGGRRVRLRQVHRSPRASTGSSPTTAGSPAAASTSATST